MKKLPAVLKKEFLILIRDIPGLAILFLMPVLLIIIVTLAQQNALKSSKETKTQILFLDNSHSDFTQMLEKNLENSGLFLIAKEYQHHKLDSTVVNELISDGKFQACLVVSRHDTAIRLMFDPAIQQGIKVSLSASLTYMIKGTQSRIAIERLMKSMAPGMEATVSRLISETLKSMTPVTEAAVTKGKSVIQPSITQNNVPGFILFAMFFIVITLSGSMITDRNDGSFLRIRTLPVTVPVILSGKVIVFVLVCILQFTLMLITGAWILPAFFGLPHLNFGISIAALLLVTFSAALAATGFGLLVGSFSRTHGQAALFGSVMVVILGVISGTFLPVYLMPDFLKYLSWISPIRWGVDGYLDIFVRQGSLLTVLPNTLLLLLFFVLSFFISIAIFAKRY